VKLLLDTHIWLWSLLDPTRLSRQVARELADSHNELWLSPISTWETVVLSRKGRIVLEGGVEHWLDRAWAAAPIRQAALTHEVARATARIRSGHNDPAGRFLVATALVYELTLVTADQNLRVAKNVPVLFNASASSA
jgi:PIN domain nuclease of toxin-antitoxin system